MASNFGNDSSRETTNFARLSRLLIDVCSAVFRSVLQVKIPYPGLTGILESQKVHISGKLDRCQKNILYPQDGVFSGTLDCLDFALLYKLLRNIQGINIPPHKNGWGKEPDIEDRSLSANIDRLRVQRNEAYGHVPKASLSDAQFDEKWKVIRQCISEIERDVLTGDTFVSAVDALLNSTMDPETERQYIQQLESMIEEVKANQEGMAKEISDISNKQDTMETQISVIYNRQDITEKQISDISNRPDTTETQISDISNNQGTTETHNSVIYNRQDTTETQISDISNRQDTTHFITAIDPKIAALTDNTCAIIKAEENMFVFTQGFHDALEKIQKNRIVVIKGNTGDGKTATANQLLLWLCKEQRGRRPLKLNNINDFDLLPTSSQFIVLIDDMFGEKVLYEREVGEWNKRINAVIPNLREGEQSQGNFIVITVRNEVYNSLKSRSMEEVFIDQNIIDLSSTTYKIDNEMMALLEFYEPNDTTFTWEENEKEAIIACTPNIGFPQCCKLFRDVPKLQKERVRFFEKPFRFLHKALARLGECSTLLFLFLNGGTLPAKDLDPNCGRVNVALLEAAFEINLFQSDDDRSTLGNKKKIEFVRNSLYTLSGSLVVKERDFRSGEVYRFCHDSVYVAVALLYAKATPVGYIQNCPSKSLSYLTISTYFQDSIGISSDHYTHLCERLIKEFECKGYDYGAAIASLDAWNNNEFLDRFVQLLNENKVDKQMVLNKACAYGAEQCALHLLSQNVKVGKGTLTCIVKGRSVEVLKKIINGLTDDIKIDLLNHSCSAGSLECAIFLLSIGVNHNEHTELWPLITNERFKGNLEKLKKVAPHLNEDTRRVMLNKACSNGTEECVEYLLNMGVKPENGTPFCVVQGGMVNVLRMLLQYEVTLTARDDTNSNVLHHACLYEREEMVKLLCDTNPQLVHGHDVEGKSPLLVAALKGNCSVFQTVENTLLKSLHRAEDKHHICEFVNDRMVHRNCVCAQYMAQEVDDEKKTVLHLSCVIGPGPLCLYLCESYPILTIAVDKAGSNVLHYIARNTSDVVMFRKCETRVKQYMESTGSQFDITRILNNQGTSVLDEAETRKTKTAKYHKTENSPLYDHLFKVFG